MREDDFQGEFFLQQLLDAIPNALYYKDTLGVYKGCNQAFEELIGWKKDDIIDKTDYEIMPRTLADKCYQMDADLLNSQMHKKNIQSFEIELKTSKGNALKASFHKSVYRETDGKVFGIIGLISDTNKVQKEESAKITALINSSVAERISIISTIVSNGVEEMNGAISAIQQISDNFNFWQDSGKEITFAQMMTQVKKVDTNIKHLKKVAKHLSNFVKKRQQEDDEPINLNQVTIGAVELLSSEFKKYGITVKSEFAGNLPMLSANLGRMEEIIINILIFAIRAFQKAASKRRQITVSSKFSMSEMKIGIFYTGDKMTRAELDSVFNPVFTEVNIDDLSLAMVISKRIVEEHKGKMMIENVGEEGILCTILFPC